MTDEQRNELVAEQRRSDFEFGVIAVAVLIPALVCLAKAVGL